MTLVYFLPGLAGSQLFETGEHALVWVDATQIAAGRVGKLRLDADGVGPGLPDGVECQPLAPLPDYYASALEQLELQLGRAGLQLWQYAYDWRKRARSTSADLAVHLRSHATPASPATLIGHSHGGLVARAAWATLAAAGQGELIRRIVTIGTPHWGSYSAVLSQWATRGAILQLSAGSLAAPLLSPYVAPGNRVGPWTPEDVLRLIGTFPGFYDCFPNLGAPNAAADPHRGEIFTAANFAIPSVWNQSLMTESKEQTCPYWSDPATMPPPAVLTCVAGRGVSTPATLDYPWLLGTPIALGSVDDGDGTVTAASAAPDGTTQIFLAGRHMDLVPQLVAAGTLLELILDPRVPPAPPPPAEEVQGSFAPARSGPPFVETIPTSPCRGGNPRPGVQCC